MATVRKNSATPRLLQKPVQAKPIVSGRTGLTESNKRFQAADSFRTEQRKQLLQPDDVSGAYDVGRKLYTTLGGMPRVITRDDLRHFQAVSNKLSKKLKHGVTARDVINMSMPIDRTRANQEIHTAHPISRQAGAVIFTTNSGPNSDVKRHYVKVAFPNFQALVASSAPLTKTGGMLRSSPLQISCSCGRWRFWFAFMASRAGYNSGHMETGFPKVMNPGLGGIACKHILRVMLMVEKSPATKLYFQSMVELARGTVQQRRVHEKKDAALEFVEKASKERSKIIKPGVAAKAKVALQKAVATVAERVSKRAGAAKNDLDAAVRKAAKAGILTPAQLAALATILKGK
jgi:SWIM zinc finger